MKAQWGIICFLLFSSTICAAAPFPAMGSSVLFDMNKVPFFIGDRYKIVSSSSEWIPANSSTAKDSISALARFELKKSAHRNTVAEFSIRIEQIEGHDSLEKMAKKWSRDYTNFGFEVLGLKFIQLNGDRAILVDLVNKNRNKQLRQVIFKKDQQLAVATCLASTEEFSAALPHCNKMMRGFQWQGR